jgi:hypothetical protein
MPRTSVVDLFLHIAEGPAEELELRTERKGHQARIQGAVSAASIE